MWDPEQYARFAGERGRPFVELLNRVDLRSPRRVVDLGCGPGNLTAMLADRWSDATVVGIDSSPEMISAASSIDGVTFRLDDMTAFRPDPDTDLLISNAALQWVPGHAELLRSWAATLPPGASCSRRCHRPTPLTSRPSMRRGCGKRIPPALVGRSSRFGGFSASDER